MPQQGNVTSFSWNANLPFYCYINNEDIYHYNGEIVGVSISKYKQVEEALSKCKNRLIELGEIKLPKTPEELLKEQTDVIEKQSKLLADVMNELKQMRGNYEPRTVESTNELPTREYEGESDTIHEQGVGDDRPKSDTDNGGRQKSIQRSKKSRDE